MNLNQGQGRCVCAAQLRLAPTAAVAGMGAAFDVRQRALDAVHRLNRTGDRGDFLAVALKVPAAPEFHARANRESEPGDDASLTVFGSEASLGALLGDEGLRGLIARQAFDPAEVEEVFFDAGDEGAAFVRDRSVEKQGATAIERRKRRALRRGHAWVDLPARPFNAKAVAVLGYVGKALHVRRKVGAWGGGPLLVSTYGFSRSDAPAFLPVPVGA